MPNWTQVKLYVTGELDDIKALFETGLSLDAMVPISIEPEETLRDRRIDGWGTKWEADKVESEMCDINCCLHGTFSTAWDPPLQAYLTFSASHPSLHFTMLYIGECIASGEVGRVSFKSGVVIRKTELEAF